MRRIVLALLALAVLLPSVAQARACWMTDLAADVREACCCPVPAETGDAAAALAVAPAPVTLQSVCCHIEKRTTSQLPIVPTASPPASAAVLVSVIEIERSIPIAAVAPPPRGVAQAPPSPTLLAQHRGLLL